MSATSQQPGYTFSARVTFGKTQRLMQHYCKTSTVACVIECLLFSVFYICRVDDNLDISSGIYCTLSNK